MKGGFEIMKLFNKSKKNDNTKNERVEYVICPRCKQEVVKEAIMCPFCKFDILAYINGDIDENGDAVKKLKKNK